MDKKKKQAIKRAVALSLAAILVLFLAFLPLIAKQDADKDGIQASILKGTAETGSIEQALIGGGALAEEEPVAVEIPETVKLEEFLVENGQILKKGDAIASVDRVTVMSAITEIQNTLDYLAEEIESEGKKDTDTEVVALAGGTVKLLYASAGDSVQSVMLQHGALAVLSLDGLMAVDLTAKTSLTAGSPVKVTLSSGTVTDGKLESNLSGELTVTLEDQDYTVGEAVSVADENGEILGSGSLYIYSPWSAAAYTGTVKQVKISQGDTVKAGKTIITLSDTGYTARYQKLVSQRQTYEELMQQLFEMYQTKILSAPADGAVSGIDKDSAQLLSFKNSLSVTLLAGAPNGNDETLYANYLGKVTAIGQNGWSLQVDPNNIPISDYKNLPADLTEKANMTEVVLCNPVPEEGAPIPIYEAVEGNWQALESTAIAAGDVLLFAKNENDQIVWIVRVQKASSTPSDTPATPNDPQNPSGGNTGKPGTTLPDSVIRPGGSTGGNWTGTTPQIEEAPESQLFETNLTQVATVTPQDTMTLEILVDELDVGAVQRGMTARIKIDALGGEKVDATVTDVGGVGTSNGGSSKFTVTLSFPRGENMLAGMTAVASIPTEGVSTALLLPAAALVDAGTKTYVYTAYDEKNDTLLKPVEVKTGASDGENVEILDGLKENDTYYYAYYDTLVISDTPDFGSGGMFQFGR